MRIEIQKDLCLHLIAEIHTDKYGQEEIGDYKCNYYACKKPPCHRKAGDIGFVDMFDCKHRALTEEEKTI